MIVRAVETDGETVNGLFEEIMDYEERTTKYSVFQKDVYPTADLLMHYIKDGIVFLLQNAENEYCGCIVCDYEEPEEYRGLNWTSGKAIVIHLLAISPRQYGKGYGSALVEHIFRFAKEQGCISVKLDTGGQNKPARHLYEKKLGFRVVAVREMNVGGIIEHKEHYFFEHLI